MNAGAAVAGAARPIARRQFDLPEEDAEYLDARGLYWETVVADGDSSLWLLLHDYPLPAGYACATNAGVQPVDTALVGVRLTGYPGGALDMAYFHPALQRGDGRALHSVGELQLDGKTFQQWSRHYTSGNPFRVGTDNIATHLGVMDEWLRRELGR